MCIGHGRVWLMDAHEDAYRAAVREMFIEYAQSLGFSLCFQGFDRELAELPGKYAPPQGAILLAAMDGAAHGEQPPSAAMGGAGVPPATESVGVSPPKLGDARSPHHALCAVGPDKCVHADKNAPGTDADRLAGCVALRPLGPDVCEMKRLYVRPAFRSLGVGRLLAAGIIERGRQIGYRRMRLDTLTSLTAAIRLYESLSFHPTEPYGYNPLPGVLYFERALGSRTARARLPALPAPHSQ